MKKYLFSLTLLAALFNNNQTYAIFRATGKIFTQAAQKINTSPATIKAASLAGLVGSINAMHVIVNEKDTNKSFFKKYKESISKNGLWFGCITLPLLLAKKPTATKQFIKTALVTPAVIVGTTTVYTGAALLFNPELLLPIFKEEKELKELIASLQEEKTQ